MKSAQEWPTPETVTRCPACSGTGQLARRDVTDRRWQVPGAWSYQRCDHCRSLWLSPRPQDADEALWYPRAYFTHQRPSGSPAAPPLLSATRRLILAGALGYAHLYRGPGLAMAAGRLLACVPWLRRYATHNLGPCLPPFRKGGALLDVGCGNGQFLARMQQYGWRVSGIEPDPLATRVAREELGLTVHNGSAADAPFDRGSFDVVTSRQVLEHVADPIPFLREIATYLKPGGSLIMVMPNGGSLGHTWFGGDCYSLDPPRHLVLYTTDGIRRLFDHVPELRLAMLRTTSLRARKVFKQWRIVRKSGAFGTPDATLTPAEKLATSLFAWAESLATRFAPVGEEIELVALKQH